MHVNSLLEKKAFIFDLDDVLYPERDFWLQVYYLFTHFVEFTAGEVQAEILLNTFKSSYEDSGAEGVFDRVKTQFPVIETFKDNFDRLEHQAQLPLKLHLYEGMQELIQKLAKHDKLILILTAGDPLGQLNKIKQVEWNGMEDRLKVYFEDELNFTQTEPFRYLREALNMSNEEMSYIGRSPAVLRSAQEQGLQVWTGADLERLKEINIKSNE